MIYVVIAYRWGHLNEHQYIYHAGLDREVALDAAESEADNRGGKYGVAVYANDGEHHDLIDYTPSTFGELMPTHNCHTDKFITLGLAACNWVQDGKAWLPRGEGTLNYKPVDPPPQWLIDRVKKEDDMAKFMSELRQGKIAKAEILGIDMGVPNENSFRPAKVLAERPERELTDEERAELKAKRRNMFSAKVAVEKAPVDA